MYAYIFNAAHMYTVLNLAAVRICLRDQSVGESDLSKGDAADVLLHSKTEGLEASSICCPLHFLLISLFFALHLRVFFSFFLNLLQLPLQMQLCFCSCLFVGWLVSY